jgi:hypothetical protein
MASLAIAIKDEEVASKCVAQLQSHVSPKIEDVLLEASLLLQFGNPEKAAKALLKAIHISPTDMELRTYYTQVILTHFPSDYPAVLTCVNRFVSHFLTQEISR